MNINYGDVPLWIEAIGTLGAFIIALTIYFQSVKNSKKAQARYVATWQIQIQPDSLPYPTIMYDVLNNSNEPIYSITFGAQCGVLGTFVRHIGTLGPKERRRITVYLPGNPKSERYASEIIFTDATGTLWFRNVNGNLREITSKEISGLIHEDAGAFNSTSDHPTLHKFPDGQPKEGLLLYGKDLTLN